MIVNSRKYDQTIRRSWACDFVRRDGDLHVFAGVFEEEVIHPELGQINRGTVSYEYYWLDRWYNIFRFHEPDGKFRNYYCNISMPPVLSIGSIDYVDLDIDVLVWPSGEYQIVDMAEFEENAVKYNYPNSVQTSAMSALDELIEMARHGLLPAT